MSGKIYINYSDVEERVKKLDEIYDQMTGILNSLAKIKHELADAWEDPVFLTFAPQYEAQIERLESLKVSVDALITLLQLAKRSYAEADAALLEKI